MGIRYKSDVQKLYPGAKCWVSATGGIMWRQYAELAKYVCIGHGISPWHAWKDAWEKRYAQG